MTLILELPPQVEAVLTAEAEAQGRTVAEVAVDVLRERFTDTMDEETAAAIQRGLDDAVAGRTLTVEQARAEADAALDARFGGGKTASPAP